MEDDILHFPEGVLVDDVIGAGLVGIVALREDRKTVIKFAPSNTFQHFIDVERRVYERLNSAPMQAQSGEQINADPPTSMFFWNVSQHLLSRVHSSG